MKQQLNNRKDVFGKVTGKAQYANDIQLPGMLHAVVVRCAIPNGRLVKIDTAEARASAGVAGVLLAKDIPGSPNLPKERPVLCGDRVRYCGDGVAMVLADTREEAAAAAALVKASYETLPTVFDPEEALLENAPLVHEEYTKSNEICRFVTKRGDVDEAFKGCDRILERTYETQRVQHVCLETEAVVAEYDETTGLTTVYCPVNSPFPIRAVVANTLGCPLTDVRIVLSTIGASFGGKNFDIAVNSSRAAVAAKKFGRPCKLVLSREESIEEGTKRHPIIARYRVGVNNDGLLQAARIEVILDGGSYTSKTFPVTSRMAIEATGPYYYPAVDTVSKSVYTNHVYSDALRGFGSPQVDFCSESLMDEIALELGMDPLVLREKNMLKTGSPSSFGQLMEDVTLPECIAALENAAHLEERRAEAKAYNETHTHSKKGVGIALLHRGESFGAAGQGIDTASGMVSLQPDGSVTVVTSISEVGQGAQTMMVNLTHEALGIPREKIRVPRVDTSVMTDAGATVATRGTVFSGNAVHRALESILEKLTDYAEPHLHTRELAFENETIFERGKPENAIPLIEVIREVFANSDHLNSLGYFKAPEFSYDKANGTGDAYMCYVYGASAATVTVDLQTGVVTPDEFFAVHDVGHAFDLEEVKGQMCGGIVMGIGYALMEEVETKNGRIRNRNYESYLIPTVLDIPHITAIAVEMPGPYGPLGAKGLGEPATCMAAPAIINAIADATGDRVRAMPADLERVALHKKIKKG